LWERVAGWENGTSMRRIGIQSAVAALALVAAGLPGTVAAAATVAPCGATGTIEVWAVNDSGQPSVRMEVEGVLDPASVTCTGGPALRDAYAAAVDCRGTGLVRCQDDAGLPARVAGLRPGAWVHRMRASVAAAPGDAANDVQQQARRSVVLGPPADGDARNPVVWSIYGFVRAVASDRAADVRAALAAAGDWTAAHPDRRALVTLRPPGPIVLDGRRCREDIACDPSLDAPNAGLCVDGDRIVLDGRDDLGRVGAELGVGAQLLPVVRIYGADVELRGLALVGMQDNTTAQADTVSFMSSARRSAVIDSVVRGPSRGDGVGSCGGGSDGDANLVVDSVVRGAQDKGVKVIGGGVQVVSGSCIADNANGGIQATLGGRAIARQNVVQHNVPSGAENGISANDSGGAPSSVATRGNIVRFSGERGLSVVGNGMGEFRDDYVARNQYAGARVETTRPDIAAQASFSGTAFVCNKVAFVSASCTDPDGTPCIDATDCAAGGRCTTTFPDGDGLGIQFPRSGECACDAPPCPCPAPVVMLGDGGAGTPEVALTLNGRTKNGANLQLNVPGGVLAAGGTQWQDCLAPTCGPASEDAVRRINVREAAGAHVDLQPVVAVPARVPSLTGLSPARPRARDVVRVYGRGFDAIEGNALSLSCQQPPDRDADFCDPADPKLAQINRSASGNRLRLVMGLQSWSLDLAAVTPSMLAFRMPVDCFAPARIELRRGTQTVSLPACDPDGCGGQPPGVSCTDDADPCTDDVCDGEGACVHLARPAGTVCRPAAGPCDVAESCDGTGAGCPPDAKRAAGDVCRAATGPCDEVERCGGVDDRCPDDRMQAPGAVCRPAAGPCDVAETCSPGRADCPANVVRAADVVCRQPAGDCDLAETCDGVTVACPADRLRPAGATCRAVRDGCDVVETCTGDTVTCPDDARVEGLDSVACVLPQVVALADRSCGPAERRIISLVDRAGGALERARASCAAGRIRRVRRRLRHVAHRLGRLERRVRRDPCLRGAGVRSLVAASLARVGEIRRDVPRWCAPADGARRGRSP
jgi:hypothetical protein